MAGDGVGRVIGGKYELIAALGKGGMSVVWLGRDLRLDKLWAVKEVRHDVSGAKAPTNRRALLDEAHFIKHLDHPAIPRVVDMVETSDSCFVVMDYVNGRPLSRVLSQRGRPFEQDDVVSWGMELCDVLGYLHALHPPVVYRDLKPSNVMLRDDGSIRLIDFGIADELADGHRGDGRRIGSFGYSAPEQVERQMHEEYPTDARADVYALGTTLFSLVTGIVPSRVRRPDGTTGLEFDLRPIRQVDPSLSDGLEQVIARATMRRPQDRYQTMDEMRYDLEHYEELTWRHQQDLRRRLDTFLRQLRGTAAACLLGGFCVLGGSLAQARSFETLMHEASALSAAEFAPFSEGGEEGHESPGVPTEAEAAYERAVDVAPERLEPYEGLLETYKADGVFTQAEALRWTRIWQEHGRDVRGCPHYARLCYDVGVLYLFYFDHQGGSGQGAGAASGRSSQSAVQSATLSMPWFERAIAACDPDRGAYSGLVVTEDTDEFAAAQVYRTIGEFHTSFTRSCSEGRDAGPIFQSFWAALETCLVERGQEEPLVRHAEPIVRLRLYQVAFEALDSATYLRGLMHAGVSKDESLRMLETVREGVASLEEFALANQMAAGAMFDEVTQGYAGALDNVGRTFGNPVAALQGGGDPLAGGDGQ